MIGIWKHWDQFHLPKKSARKCSKIRGALLGSKGGEEAPRPGEKNIISSGQANQGPPSPLYCVHRLVGVVTIG
jgi:hypothetical protein